MMGKHADSIDSKVLRRIRANGRGWVFTPSDFLDLGSRTTVAALIRYGRDGTVRRLGRGLDDYPKRHSAIGLLSPTSDAISYAIGGKHATRLQPSGAYAVNLLGLSEQVPMKVVYLTDGPTRRIQIGTQQILLKPTTPRNMATAGRISGLVIQALRFLGKEATADSTVKALKSKLSDEDKAQLLMDVRYAPAWIADIIRDVAADSVQTK